MWPSEKTNHLKRGDHRVVIKFAWLPTALGYGNSEDPLVKRLGKTVWLRRYESHQAWWDWSYDADYRWREVARFEIGFDRSTLPKSPEYKSPRMLFPDVPRTP